MAQQNLRDQDQLRHISNITSTTETVCRNVLRKFGIYIRFQILWQINSRRVDLNQ